MIRRRVESALLLAVCVVVAWFHVWTVRSSGDPWKFGQEQRDYYNLLVDGWLDGQLHLKVDVPPALLQLRNPYDHRARPEGLGLHDASFYRGRYYLYFGAGPVVALMLPFRLLTGIDLPLPVATLVYVQGAFLASAAMWLMIRRRYFPEAGPWVAALGVLALGFAGLGPVLLRRTQIWELPIAAGSCFALLALLCVFRSLHSSRRAAWLAAAGLCLGLAIASRATYLVATPLLAAPLLAWWREERRCPWRPAVAAALPLAVIGALLAWHNWLRFGDPFQSGQAYQFNFDYDSKLDYFRTRYVPLNGWRYFFAPAQWSPYFPFIAPAALPPGAQTFGGHEDVYGVLVNLPLAWAAFLAPLGLWRRTAGERRLLGAWLGAAAIVFAAVTAVLLCFFGATVRYQLDFTPSLILLACVGILALERWARLALPPGARVVPRIVWGGALFFSVVFAAVCSLQVNGLFRERNPGKYRDVARILNHIPAWFEPVLGVRHGAVEFELRLPGAPAGRAETLLTVGNPPNVNRVFVRYVDIGYVQFGFARPVMPEVVSEPIAIDPARPHRLRVMLGAFLPPDTHPLFARLEPGTARRASRLVRLELEGAVIVDAYRRFEGVAGSRVRLGALSLGEAAHPRFSGEILATRRIALAPQELAALLPPAPGPLAAETFRLKLVFPRDRVGAREPLVVTGATGAGDVLGVEYLADGRLCFLFDHWGSRHLRSEPVRLDLSAAHDVHVHMPWLAPSAEGRKEQRGDLRVEVDGTLVWLQGTMAYRADPEEIALGKNPIGGSVCGPLFTGQVLAAERTAK